MSQPVVYVIRSSIIMQRLMQFLTTLGPDGEWEVIIRKHDPNRSGEQNSLAWVITDAVADQVLPDGSKFTKDSWWTHFKREYFGPSLIILPMGGVIEQETTSASRGKKAFSGFLESIFKFSAEHGVILPDEAIEYKGRHAHD